MLGCGTLPERGGRKVDVYDLPEGVDPSTAYKPAKLGYVSELGFFWDRCPRYYLEFVTPQTKKLARRILQLRLWAERGGLQREDLTAGEAALIDQADRHMAIITRKRREAAKRAGD